MFSRIFKSSKGERERDRVCSKTVAAENVDQAFKIKTLMLWSSDLIVGFFPFFQLESLLQLWLTLSLNSSSSGSKDSGADIFLYNANRIPVVSLNQGKIH